MEGECLYSILKVERDATDDEIRKAYRTEALLSHPDKNRGREDEAAEHFKKVQHAYSVLSDPHERAWYDNHRAQILRSGNTFSNADPSATAEARDATNVDLFKGFSASCFTGFTDDKNGFYGVYGALFDELWAEETDAFKQNGGRQRVGTPFGGSEAPWTTVREFYSSWESFSSAKSFSFGDKWNLSEAPNREVRRLMEKENKKERVKLKKEFNDTVRQLVAYVKKRDPRVAHRKKEEEALKAKQEQERIDRERKKAATRKQDAEQTRLMRDMALEEDAEALDEILRSIELDDRIERRKNKKKRNRAGVGAQRETIGYSEEENEEGDAIQLPSDSEHLQESSDDNDSEEDMEEDERYCVACRKTFRSAAHRVDHERSKKHKAAVTKLRRQMEKEERDFQKAKVSSVPDQDVEIEEEERNGIDENMKDLNSSPVSQRAKSKKKKKRQKQRETALGSHEAADALVDDATHGNSNGNGEQTPSKDVPENKDGVVKDSAQPQLTKRQKRKLREQRKRESGTTSQSSSSLSCNVCQASFPSRNKLMKHVSASGHALHK